MHDALRSYIFTKLHHRIKNYIMHVYFPLFLTEKNNQCIYITLAIPAWGEFVSESAAINPIHVCHAMTLICTSQLDVGRVAGVGADWLRESPSGASLPAERRKAHARRADNKVMIGMAVTSPWSVAYLIGHHSDRYLRPGHCLSSYRIAYCQRPIGVVKWEGGCVTWWPYDGCTLLGYSSCSSGAFGWSALRTSDRRKGQEGLAGNVEIARGMPRSNQAHACPARVMEKQ